MFGQSRVFRLRDLQLESKEVHFHNLSADWLVRVLDGFFEVSCEERIARSLAHAVIDPNSSAFQVTATLHITAFTITLTIALRLTLQTNLSPSRPTQWQSPQLLALALEIQEPAASPPPPARSTKIVVEKLTKNVQIAHLEEIFGAYGSIDDLDMPLNRNYNVNRGTAYIVYATVAEAESAIAHMHEAQIDGQVITVAIVLPRKRFSRSPPPRREQPRGPPAYRDFDRGPPPASFRDREYERGPPSQRFDRGPPPRGPPGGGSFRSPPPRRRSPGRGGERGGGYRGGGTNTRSRSRSPRRSRRSPSYSSRSRSPSRTPPRRAGGTRRDRSPRRGPGGGGRRRSPSYDSYSSRSSDRSVSRTRGGSRR